MELDVMEAATWLQSRLDRTVTVIKREREDLDQISLTLKDIAVTTRPAPDADDYVGHQSLVLYGEGMIAGEETEAPLPGQEYEIPVVGSWNCRQENEALSIDTGRASYTIALQ